MMGSSVTPGGGAGSCTQGALGVGLRGADADHQLPGPLGGRHVPPAERGDLRAAQARAEGQRDDRAVLEAARGGRETPVDLVDAEADDRVVPLPTESSVGRRTGVFSAAARDIARAHGARVTSPHPRTTCDRLRVRSAAPVELQQFAQGVVVGNVRGPPVGGRDGRIERRVRVGEPLRPIVVEARQRAFSERLHGILVARHWTFRISGNRLVLPLDPLGRIEPPIAQLDER